LNEGKGVIQIKIKNKLNDEKETIKEGDESEFFYDWIL